MAGVQQNVFCWFLVFGGVVVEFTQKRFSRSTVWAGVEFLHGLDLRVVYGRSWLGIQPG